MKKILFVFVFLMLSSLSYADQIVLDGNKECGSGDEVGDIDVTDVTGDAGGSTHCWGLFGDKLTGEIGNDPGPGGSFLYDGMVYNFIAKSDVNEGDGSQSLSGQDIGLQIGGDTDSGCELGSGLAAGSGCWAFDGSLFSPEAFMIVLKSSSNPGYGVWLFSGSDASSTFGTWFVDWKGNDINDEYGDISHLTIYAKGVRSVPEPGTVALLGLGLLGLGFMRRRS